MGLLSDIRNSLRSVFGFEFGGGSSRGVRETTGGQAAVRNSLDQEAADTELQQRDYAKKVIDKISIKKQADRPIGLKDVLDPELARSRGIHIPSAETSEAAEGKRPGTAIQQLTALALVQASVAKIDQKISQLVQAREHASTGGRHDAILDGIDYQLRALESERGQMTVLHKASELLGGQFPSNPEDLLAARAKLQEQLEAFKGYETVGNPEAFKKSEALHADLKNLDALILGEDDLPLSKLPAELQVKAGPRLEGTHETRAAKPDEAFLKTHFSDKSEFAGEVKDVNISKTRPTPEQAKNVAVEVLAEALGVPGEQLLTDDPSKLPIDKAKFDNYIKIASNHLALADNDPQKARQAMMSDVLKSGDATPAIAKEMQQLVKLNAQLARLPESLRAELRSAAESGHIPKHIEELVLNKIRAGQVPAELRNALKLSFQTGELRPELRNALESSTGASLMSRDVVSAVKNRLESPQELSAELRVSVQQLLASGKLPAALQPTFKQALESGQLKPEQRAALASAIQSGKLPGEMKELGQKLLDVGMSPEMRESFQQLVQDKKMPSELRAALYLSPVLARLPPEVREGLQQAARASSGQVSPEVRSSISQLLESGVKLPEGLKSQLQTAAKSGDMEPELKAALLRSSDTGLLSPALRSALFDQVRAGDIPPQKVDRFLTFIEKNSQTQIGEWVKELSTKNPKMSKAEVLGEVMHKARKQLDAPSFMNAGIARGPLAASSGGAVASRGGVNITA